MKEWKIWKNYVPSFIESADCDDDIDGVCDKNITLSECIKKAPDDIDYGLFLKMKNGKTVCSHVNTFFYSKERINFNNDIVKKDNYDELKDTETWVFVNNKRNKWPDWDGNFLHYNDNINISSTVKNSIFNDSVKLLPIISFEPSKLDNLRVVNKDGIYLMNNSTNEILTVNKDKVIWDYPFVYTQIEPNNNSIFKVETISNNTLVHNKESIRLSHDDKYIKVLDDGSLTLSTKKNEATVWSIEFDDVILYDEKCKQYKYDNGIPTTLDKVSRNKLVCQAEQSTRLSTNYNGMFLIILITMVILLFYFLNIV